VSEDLPTSEMDAPRAATPPHHAPDSRFATLAPPWSALSFPHYRNLFAASFISNIGGWMEMLAIQWAMAQATLAPDWTEAGRPSAPIMMGYLAAAQLGPMLLLGLYGGIVADRVDRRKLLATTQILLAAVAAALAVESFRGAITPITLIVLGLINGVVGAFNMPAWGTITPRLVPRDQLPDAIALNGLQFNLARVVGPAAAGFWLAFSSPAWIFLFNAVSFLGVVWAVMRSPDLPTPVRAREHPWTDLREGLRFVWTHAGARTIVLAIFLFSLLATPLIRVVAIVIKDSYGGSEQDLGILFAIMGAGAVMAALTIRRIPNWYPRHHLIPLAVTIGGGCTLLVAAAPSFWVACIPMLVCGFCWLMTFNSCFAALQLLVDDAMRGRVMAIANVVSFGATPCGVFAIGLIAEAVSGKRSDGPGTQIGMASLAAVLVACGVVMLIRRSPEIDGLTRQKPRQRNAFRSLLDGVSASAHRKP
jgi:MFS family permease